MHGRLADTLIYLDNDSFAHLNLFSTLSRKDIADFSGISLESTVRLLTELKNEGIISTDGKIINIIDKKRLVEISLRG